MVTVGLSTKKSLVAEKVHCLSLGKIVYIVRIARMNRPWSLTEREVRARYQNQAATGGPQH